MPFALAVFNTVVYAIRVKNANSPRLDRFTLNSYFKSIRKRRTEMLGTILLVILILFLLGALPTWPHSRSWGYGPSGGLGLIVIILLILLLLGRI